MNERIKELAEQAGAEFEKTNGLSECRQDSLVGDEMQKFAELIVREVLQKCEAHPTWSGRMIGEEIKQHFGVE